MDPSLGRRRRLVLVVLLAILVSLFAPAPPLASVDAGEGASADEEPRERRVRLRRGKERRLRDWHNPLPDPVAKQLDQAVNYFSNSMRVPAALLAGQAGNMLIKVTDMQSAWRDPSAAARIPVSLSNRVAIYGALWRAHFLLSLYAVCSELTAVLVCSTAHAQILDISRDELALEATALDLILQHVEFEYVVVRVTFFSGLVSFLLAILSRSVALLGYAPRGGCPTGQRELLLNVAVSMMLVSTIALWMDLFSSEEISHYEGAGKLLQRCFKLLSKRIRAGGCLAILTLLNSLIALGLSCLALCNPHWLTPTALGSDRLASPRADDDQPLRTTSG